jgi:DNA-binding MarR family transcriptional regulator
MNEENGGLHRCLYFTISSLARAITKMAEEEFSITGISPSYAFLLMLVNKYPGIVQKDLCNKLNLAPSTITRFIDALARRGYLERRMEGKTAKIYLTEEGQQMQKVIETAWCALYKRYSEILGEEYSYRLTQMVDEASRKLET